MNERTEQLIETLKALAAVQSAKQTHVNREVQIVVGELMDDLQLKNNKK